MFKTFENKVKDIKGKMNKETKVLTVVLIIGTIIMILLNVGKLYEIKKQKLEDSYNNAMYQLIDYSKQIEVLLAKSRITTSKREGVIVYTDILRNANLASASLFLLPVDQNKLQNLAKYFAQVSDYSLSLSNKLLSDKQLEENDYANLEKMEKYAIDLVNVLTEIYSNLNEGILSWEELERELNKELEENKMELTSKNVRKISDAFTEYEGLIYDGAYSEHTESAKPKLLNGKNISINDAKNKVKKIIESKWINKKDSKKIIGVEYLGETKGTVVLYNFEVMLKGQKEKVYVQITKDTGLVYLMLYDKKVEKSKMNFEKAKNIGLDYLKSIGIENMESTYYIIQNNMMTINYASSQGDIIIYPDLVKLKIALDTGEVCSLEAKGYIYNHYERKNVSPSILIEEAKSKVNRDLKISNTRLAIIQTDGMEEVLTYEFARKNKQQGISNIY